MYEQLLTVLADSKARYIVVGAVALGLHHYPRATADLDLLPDLEQDNLEKIVDVLESLGFTPQVPVRSREILDPLKREAWYRDKHMLVFSFTNNRIPPQIVDLMIHPPMDYSECSMNQKAVQIQGRTIYIASIDDLLKMKKSAMRGKDLTDIQILERLKNVKTQNDEGTSDS